MENTPQPEPAPPMDSRPVDGASTESAPMASAPMASAPPDGPGSPPRQEVPGQQQPGTPRHKGADSLVLAILAPASMILTAPVSVFAMLMTYSDNGSSSRPWVTPLVLFSLPLLFATLALRLAIPALKRSPRGSGDHSAAAVALCLGGLIFALALGPALDNVGLF